MKDSGPYDPRDECHPNPSLGYTTLNKTRRSTSTNMCLSLKNYFCLSLSFCSDLFQFTPSASLLRSKPDCLSSRGLFPRNYVQDWFLLFATSRGGGDNSSHTQTGVFPPSCPLHFVMKINSTSTTYLYWLTRSSTGVNEWIMSFILKWEIVKTDGRRYSQGSLYPNIFISPDPSRREMFSSLYIKHWRNEISFPSPAQEPDKTNQPLSSFRPFYSRNNTICWTVT